MGSLIGSWRGVDDRIRYRRAALAHDKRLGAGQHMPPEAFGHPALRVGHKRFFAVEDTFRLHAEVDTLRSRAPREQFASDNFGADGVAMRLVGPFKWDAVAPGLQEQSFADGRRAV